MEYTSREVYEYVSRKSNDPIVEWKKCRLSGQEFPIYQSDLEFYDKISPTFEVSEDYAKQFFEKNSDVKNNFEYKDGKLKAKLPTPTLCPEEREANRFAFRNEGNLYRGKSSNSGNNLITTISPDKDYVVYDYKYRWSDEWDPMKFGKDILDNSFKTINILLHEVPFWDKFAINNENSEYVNITENSKNSYMCFGSEGIENCLYMYYGNHSHDCVDCRYTEGCEYCYDCTRINYCFGLKYSNGCVNCQNSSYLNKCTNCHDCFNCSNLENQSYCINNKQYTKEKYEELLPTLKFTQIEEKKVGCMQQDCEESFGNNLFNCKKSVFVGTGTELDNVKYTTIDHFADNCYDTFTGSHSCICNITGTFCYNSGYLSFCLNDKSCRYCLNCFNCSNCFGCVGLKTKEYCIFNKQYTKEDYNQTVPEIITQMIRDKQWGEFFAPQLSYYGYNESMAFYYHPLTKEEALKRGYKWSDYEAPFPKVEKFVPGEKLPKQGCKVIQEKKPEILEKILNYAIICEVSKRPFRVIKQEIDFYLKFDLPLPTKHPDIRYQERFARKDPTIMHLIHCEECGKEILSVYKPGQGKKILCEKCFNSSK